MTSDASLAIAAITGITTIVLAFFKLLVEIRQVHTLVNSRMTELLDLTRTAATAAGKLDADPSERSGQHGED